MATTHDPEREIVITRVFAAPRELVWKVWTQPEHVARWWGPRGFTTTVKMLDLRPGGRSEYVMRGPDGSEYPVCGTFKEVIPFEKIVSTDEFGEGFEGPPGVELPQGMVTAVVFEDLGDKTRLVLTISHPTAEDRRKHEAMGVVGGWSSSFDCMGDYLAALADEAAVRAVIAEQHAAIGSKDAARLMRHYAANAVTFDAKPPFRMTAAAELEKAWADCFPYMPDRFPIETRDLRVEVSGDAAFAHYLFRMATPDPTHPAGQTWMRLTGCYRKTGGAWKVVHEHRSVPFDPTSGKAVLTLDV